jgi:hypothetical protein
MFRVEEMCLLLKNGFSETPVSFYMQFIVKF